MKKHEVIKNYIERLRYLLSELDVEVITSIIDAMEVLHGKGKIYIVGNGGSAATASHMANDLSGGLKLRDIRNFDVESLSDNSSVCTAIANDIGYENIFYAQIKDKITSNDILIAISCSGNSENIIRAVEYAKERKTTVIGLTGFSGGKLKQLSDINYHIDSENGEYGLVEDLHMILDHVIYTYYISLKPETITTYTIDR
jgi:D-sedoheptulose 7-phosphate isomerase